MTRVVHLTCDECGAEALVEGYAWPDGWYHWRQKDLCHACAVPQIVAALSACVPDAEWPSVIGP
jgi:hypothetical protein